MEERNGDHVSKKAFFFSKGVTYFTRKTERHLFFILTLIMLIWGILVKFDFLTD
jgi:hypothetical protein